jgi:hypothetical protein
MFWGTPTASCLILVIEMKTLISYVSSVEEASDFIPVLEDFIRIYYTIESALGILIENSKISWWIH